MAQCQMRISKFCKPNETFWSGLVEVNVCESCHDKYIRQVKQAGGLQGTVSTPPVDARSDKQKVRDAQFAREDGF